MDINIRVRIMMKNRLKLFLVVAIVALGGGVFVAGAASGDCLNNTGATAVYCDYPKLWAEKYDTVTLNSNQLQLVFDQLLPKQKTDAPGDFQSQGSAFAGDYVIYSAHSTKNQNSGGYQYVYVQNVVTGKKVEIKSKDWWHIHSIWYSFSNNRFRVNGKRGTEVNDDCYEIVEDRSVSTGFKLKAVALSECGVSKPKSYNDGLMRQGGTKDQSVDGPYKGYTFYAYSDGGASATDQKYYYKKDNSAVLIHDENKNVAKAIIIPAGVGGGELEGVSTDPQGNMYLSFGIGNGSLKTEKRIRVYKVALEEFKPVKAEPEPVVPDEPEPEPEPEEEPEDESEEESKEESEPTPTPTPPATVNVCDDPNIAMSVKQAAGCLEAQPELVQRIVNILNVIVGILGLVCVGVMVYAGVIYMTSVGAPEKTKKAKNIILYAVIGLIVCALAFAIVNFVISKIQ